MTTAPARWPVLPGPKVRWAAFLDVDGGLLDLEATPGEVVVPPDVIELVERLQRVLGGALALLSGRAIADLDRLFHPLRLPCAGTHGAERRSMDGETYGAPSDRVFLAHARVVLGQFASTHPGTLVEDKEVALALHTRRSPGARREAATVVMSLAELSDGRYGVQRGKEVFELKPRAADKGTALSAFMAEPPFAGRRPVVTGDDLTDADAFRAAALLDGISVAIGSDAPSAMFRLADPADCRNWLGWLLASADEPGARDGR